MKYSKDIDPFPEREVIRGEHLWIYGRAEREVFRQQQLIRAKNEACLKVGYPGEFMLPHEKMYFRAYFPEGVFPLFCVGTPKITEIRMTEPGVCQFSLSVPDIETELPCFRCDADVKWESSFDGETWYYTTAVTGGDEPPHRERLPVLQLVPEKLSENMYDAGREIWGRIFISCAPEAELFVGESVAEAENREPDGFEQRLDLIRRDDGILCSAVPLAFRYISLEHADNAKVWIEAIYTPLVLRKRFSSGDAELDAIWERSIYTLRLCTHYFMIDGVKRDRLPWAGDLAVSLLSMAESFCEAAPIRDTLAVLGSAGVRNTHINGIFDYTLWYLINFELYEEHFGDVEFLQQEYFRIVDTAEVLLEQRLENGLLPVSGWVLIDWAEGDKNCALQILFFMALKALEKLSLRMNDTAQAEQYKRIAGEVRNIIRQDFYDEKTGLYRCSPGKNEYLRHQNFLAIGSIATPEEERRICEHLLKNDLPAVGTPYMKTFEILALIRSGARQEAVEEIRRFWGGMMKADATTFFEAYGEGCCGKGLYDFYDRPFGLSLCHAWGSAPAFLLPLIFKKK